MSSDITRRSIVAGVASLPIAGAAAAAPLAAPAAGADPIFASSADQPLFDIEAKVRGLHEQAKSASKIHDQAEEALCEWKRRNPKPAVSAAVINAAMAEVIKQYGHVVTVAKVALINTITKSNPKAVIAEHDEAMNEWDRRYKIAGANCRHEEAEKAFSTLLIAIDELLFAASEIRATTIAGVQCKARLLNGFDSEHETLNDSMIADLLVLKPAA